MISVIYASISALIITWLSLNVIKKRRINEVSVGDGDVVELKVVMAAQSNAVEYIPITLLLLFALEYNGATVVVIHIFGLALITGRLIHANGILTEKMKVRVLGMQITIYTIIGLAVANFVYLPYEKLLKF